MKQIQDDKKKVVKKAKEAGGLVSGSPDHLAVTQTIQTLLISSSVLSSLLLTSFNAGWNTLSLKLEVPIAPLPNNGTFPVVTQTPSLNISPLFLMLGQGRALVQTRQNSPAEQRGDSA